MKQPSFDQYSSPIGPMPQASGGMGEMNLYDSKQSNAEKFLTVDIPKFADGGFLGWWNKGRNVRIPNENTARFGDIRQYMPNAKIDKSTLFGDDVSQVTRSNKAFKSGATGYKGWNPIKAFTPDMVRLVQHLLSAKQLKDLSVLLHIHLLWH